MKPTQAALATILLLALSGCGPEDPDKQTSEAAPVYTEGSRGAASGNDEPDSYEAPLPLARFTLRTKLHEGWQNIVGMDRYFADASAHLEEDGIRAVDQLAKGDGCFLENFHLLTYDHSAPISAFRVVTGEEYSDGRACLETIDGVDDAEDGWRFIGEFCMSKCNTPSRPSHPYFHVEVHMPVEPQPEL